MVALKAGIRLAWRCWRRAVAPALETPSKIRVGRPRQRKKSVNSAAADVIVHPVAACVGARPMRIRLFGETGLTPIAGEPIRFATRKSMLLLAALVLSGPRGGRRDVLSGVLWPDREYAQARASCARLWSTSDVPYLRMALTQSRLRPMRS